ncbi:MAG: hypothetical protein KI791_07445 [Cyclobacteriaceae bacterium]|nr:hypothetical protein [Cyclobacteriaceae bacterium SS2]
MAIAKIHSTLFSALNTSRPISKPSESEIPGAWNFSQASMKLIAHTNPIHKNEQTIAIGLFIE